MFNVQNLQKEEFPQFLNILSQEDWYVEKVYLELLYKEFKDDFFIAKVKDKPIGYILALRYTKISAFISNFIILKEFRCLGYGQILFKYALNHLSNYQISLECDKNKENFYLKNGFKSYYDNIHYLYENKSIKTISQTLTITQHFDAEVLYEHNKSSIGHKLAKHINRVIQDENTQFRVIYKEKKISSFALSRQYKDGYKVLIVSDNDVEIKNIFFSISNSYLKGSKIYIEVTKLEPKLLSLIHSLNMCEYTKKSKMYNKIL